MNEGFFFKINPSTFIYFYSKHYINNIKTKLAMYQNLRHYDKNNINRSKKH